MVDFRQYLLGEITFMTSSLLFCISSFFGTWVWFIRKKLVLQSQILSFQTPADMEGKKHIWQSCPFASISIPFNQKILRLINSKKKKKENQKLSVKSKYMWLLWWFIMSVWFQIDLPWRCVSLLYLQPIKAFSTLTVQWREKKIIWDLPCWIFYTLYKTIVLLLSLLSIWIKAFHTKIILTKVFTRLTN